jgi:hypothetical protein
MSGGGTEQHSASWPGSSRPPTSFWLLGSEDMDARHKAGHDESEIVAANSHVGHGLGGANVVAVNEISVIALRLRAP